MALTQRANAELVLWLKANADNLTKGLTSTQTEIKKVKDTTEKVGESMTGAVFKGGLLKDMFIKVGQSAINLARNINAGAKEINAYRDTLSAAIQDEKLAGDTYNWLTEQIISGKNAFKMPELIDATTKLRTFNMNAVEWIPLVGNLAAKTNQSIQTTSDVLTRALTGNERYLLMLERQFNINRKTLAAYGADFTKNTEGKIKNLDSLRNAMKRYIQENAEGAMAEKTKDVWNQWERVNLAIKNFYFEAFQKVGPALKPFFEGLILIIKNWKTFAGIIFDSDSELKFFGKTLINIELLFTKGSKAILGWTTAIKVGIEKYKMANEVYQAAQKNQKINIEELERNTNDKINKIYQNFIFRSQELEEIEKQLKTTRVKDTKETTEEEKKLMKEWADYSKKTKNQEAKDESKRNKEKEDYIKSIQEMNKQSMAWLEKEEFESGNRVLKNRKDIAEKEQKIIEENYEIEKKWIELAKDNAVKEFEDKYNIAELLRQENLQQEINALKIIENEEKKKEEDRKKRKEKEQQDWMNFSKTVTDILMTVEQTGISTYLNIMNSSAQMQKQTEENFIKEQEILYKKLEIARQTGENTGQIYMDLAALQVKYNQEIKESEEMKANAIKESTKSAGMTVVDTIVGLIRAEAARGILWAISKSVETVGLSLLAIPAIIAGEITAEIAANAAKGLIASAQYGMDYVPRTQPILVHEEEAILNKSQAKQWREGKSGNTIIIQNPVFRRKSDIDYLRQTFIKTNNLEKMAWGI